MPETIPRQDRRLKAFISYSRRDLDAVDPLVSGLEANGIEVLIDRRDLPFGEQWQRVLLEFIRDCDTVIFLVSSHSVMGSPWCAWELQKVTELNKRLMPIVLERLAPEHLPPAIAAIELLPKDGVYRHEQHLALLIAALNTNRAWLMEGTRLADRARQWLDKKRDGAMLLRGAALADADTWRASRPSSAPPPASGILDLIAASQLAARRRQRLGLVSLLVLTTTAVATAIYTLGLNTQLQDANVKTEEQRDLAVRREAEAVAAQKEENTQRSIAEEQRKQAEVQRDRALSNQSRYLVNQAGNQLAQGYPALALALSLEALPDPRFDIVRPYVAEADRELRRSIADVRERATLRGHTWTVTNVAFSPDGRMLLTSSDDHSVRLWDAATWTELAVLKDESGAMITANFSPDGKQVVAAAFDGIARVFDVFTGRVLHRLEGHTKTLHDALYSPQGDRILTLSSDKTPHLWDAASGRLVAVLSDNTDITRRGAFTSDGQSLLTGSNDGTITLRRISDGATVWQTRLGEIEFENLAPGADGTMIAVSCSDGAIRLLDGKTGALIRSLTLPGAAAKAIAFSPDGKQIAGAYADHVVRVWQSASGQQLFEAKGHVGAISAIAYSPGGSLIATTSADTTVRLWDARTGAQTSVLKGHRSYVRKAAFSPDGTLLATISGVSSGLDQDYSARVWRLAPTLEVGVVREHRRMLGMEAASPNGRFVLLTDAKGGRLPAMAKLWDGVTGAELRHLTVNGVSIQQVSASHSGSRIVTLDARGSAWLWDVGSAALVASFEPQGKRITAAAFSDDGMLLALSDDDPGSRGGKRQIFVVSTKDGQGTATLSGHGQASRHLVFSSDGKRVLALSEDHSGENAGHAWSLAAPSAPVPLSADRNKIEQAVFADGGKVVLAHDDDAVRSLDAIDGHQIEAWPGSTLIGGKTVFSADGRAFASIFRDESFRAKLRLVNRSARKVALIDLDRSGLEQVIVSRNGQRFAAYGHRRIIVYDSADWSTVRALEVETPGPLALSDDGALLAVGSATGAVEVHTLSIRGDAVRLSVSAHSITSMKFSNDGAHLLTVSRDGQVHRWAVRDGRETHSFRTGDAPLRDMMELAGARILTFESDAPSSRGDALVVAAETAEIVCRIAAPGRQDELSLHVSTSAAFSSDGSRLLLGEVDRNLAVYDTASCQSIRDLPPDARSRRSGVALSPSGRLVALASRAPRGRGREETITIIAVDDGAVVRSIVVPRATEGEFEVASASIRFTSDDTVLLVGGRAWSIDTGEMVRDLSLDGSGQLTPSPDGRLLAAVVRVPPPPPRFQNAAAIWNAETGSETFQLRHSGPVKALALTPDGSTLATSAQDRQLRLWDTASGQETGQISLTSSGDRLGLGGSVSQIYFFPDGRRLAVTSVLSGDVQVVDVATRSVAGVLRGHRQEPKSLVFSPDGKHLATSSSSFEDGGLRLWDAETLAPRLTLPWKSSVYGIPIAFSPDGKHLVGAPDGTQALVIETATGRLIATLRGHHFRVTAVGYSPDGRWIATSSTDEQLRLWDTGSYKERIIRTGHRNGVTAVRFSGDGRLIVVGGQDGRISVWPLVSEDKSWTLDGDGSPIKSLDFFGDTTRLMSVHASDTVRTWDISTRRQLAELAHTGNISGVAVAPKQGAVVSAAQAPGRREATFGLSVLDRHNGKLLPIRYEQKGSFAVAFSPAGDRLLTISRPSKASLWRLSDGSLIADLQTAARNMVMIGAAVFTPDGHQIVTYAGLGETAHVWDAEDGAFLGGLSGRPGTGTAADVMAPKIEHVAFTRDGSRLITHSGDGFARIWDIDDGALIMSTDLSRARASGVLGGGSRLLSMEHDGSVRLLMVLGSTEDAIAMGCRMLPAPLSVEERQRFSLDLDPERYTCGRRP